jgi:hypothetical protein
MTKLMQRLSILVLLLIVFNKTYGQTRNAGQFTHTSGSKTQQVNYSVTPEPPLTNEVYVTLNSTPDSLFLSIDITNSADSVLFHWAPSSADNTYIHGFDISSLASGDYKVKVNDNTTHFHTISFTK